MEVLALDVDSAGIIFMVTAGASGYPVLFPLMSLC